MAETVLSEFDSTMEINGEPRRVRVCLGYEKLEIYANRDNSEAWTLAEGYRGLNLIDPPADAWYILKVYPKENVLQFPSREKNVDEELSQTA